MRQTFWIGVSTMQETALSDMRVLDLTNYLAGPFCTKLLSTYGADVIKIEKPGSGDPARNMGPFPNDEPHLEKSGTFFHLNLNKRSVTLNLKSKTGKDIFKEMVRDADMVVESFRPHVMRELGLSYEILKQIKPNIVLTSITNFGQTGPYAEYKSSEMVLYGMGGPMYNKGNPDREPVSLGLPTALYHGGSVAAAGAMGAFFGARYQNTGQHVDVSLMEATLGSVDGRIGVLLAYQYSGEVTDRDNAAGGFANGVYPCQDGYFVMAASGNRMFPRLVKMMGDPEPLLDPRYLTPEGQRDPDLRDLFEAVLIGWTMEHSKREIAQLGAENGLICGALNTIAEVDTDPHFNEREVFVEVEHPDLGKLRTIGRPFIMHESPWNIERTAPRLGEHNEEVLGDMGYTKEQLMRLRSTGVI